MPSKKYLKRNIGLIAAVITASPFFSVLSMMKFVLDNYKNKQHTLVFSYPWVSSMGINFGFLTDMISLPIGLIIALISTLSCIYSIRYVEKEPSQAGYYASLLIFMTGMMGVIFNLNYPLQCFFAFSTALLIAVLEGGYSVEGALPYTNLGIIAAMVGTNISQIREPRNYLKLLRLRKDEVALEKQGTLK